MKYLEPTSGGYFTNDEKSRVEWAEKFKQWEAELQTIIPRLPKRFVQELCKEYFHDSNVKEIYIASVNAKRGYRYDIKMLMGDGYDSSICHEITFMNVSLLKCDLNFFIGCEWLYCEWLPVDEKTMSLEVIFSNLHRIYLEFKNLKYKKERNTLDVSF